MSGQQNEVHAAPKIDVETYVPTWIEPPSDDPLELIEQWETGVVNCEIAGVPKLIQQALIKIRKTNVPTRNINRAFLYGCFRRWNPDDPMPSWRTSDWDLWKDVEEYCRVDGGATEVSAATAKSNLNKPSDNDDENKEVVNDGTGPEYAKYWQRRLQVYKKKYGDL